MSVTFPQDAANKQVAVVNNGTSNSSITVARPANAVEGTTVFLYLMSNNATTGNTYTPPTGFTPIITNQASNGSFTVIFSTWWKQLTADDEELDDFTVNIATPTTGDDRLVCQVVSGGNAASLIGATSTIGGTYGTDINTNTLTTTAANSTVLYLIGTRGASALANIEDPVPPTGTNLIEVNRTRNAGISAGLGFGAAWREYPTSGTVTGTVVWDDFNTASTYSTTLAIEFKVAPQSILSVNDDTDTLLIGGTHPISTVGYEGEGNAVVSGSVDGVALSSASNTSITLASFIAGQTAPRPGPNRSLMVTNGVVPSNRTVTVYSPAGLTAVKIVAGFLTGNNSLFLGFDPQVEIDDYIHYDPTKGTLFGNGGWQSSFDGITTMYHQQNSTKIVRPFLVVTANGETPTPFNLTVLFGNINSAVPNTYYRTIPVTIAGLTEPADISAVGDLEYSINGGLFTTIAGTIENGDVLQCRLLSGTYSASVNGSIIVGSLSRSLTIITRPVSVPETDITLSSTQQLVNLINSENGDLGLEVGDLIFGNPAPHVGVNPGNTDVNVTAADGYVGSVTLNYNRLPLDEYINRAEPELTFSSQPSLITVVSGFNTLYGCNLTTGDFAVVTVPTVTEEGIAFTLAAHPNSLVYVGEIDLVLKLVV